mmetsp:Transcript_43221/g.123628  ORF Transcript_43221/g.123628 Transcript_43221/m.123628 type:complete len:203 (-) Transcript_43221:890-1498(-)
MHPARGIHLDAVHVVDQARHPSAAAGLDLRAELLEGCHASSSQLLLETHILRRQDQVGLDLVVARLRKLPHLAVQALLHHAMALHLVVSALALDIALAGLLHGGVEHVLSHALLLLLPQVRLAVRVVDLLPMIDEARGQGASAVEGPEGRFGELLRAELPCILVAILGEVRVEEEVRVLQPQELLNLLSAIVGHVLVVDLLF